MESSILLFAKDTAVDVSHICATYPELSSTRLQLHFKMFPDMCTENKATISTITDILYVFSSRCIRELLPELFNALRIFLTIPVTTRTSERSFLLVRRLDTYLRSTMGQSRLNHTATLTCYKEETDSLNIQDYTQSLSLVMNNAEKPSRFRLQQI